MVRYPYPTPQLTTVDPAGYSIERMQSLYHDMLRIRRIEEEIERRYCEDEMKTPIHLVIGQEATSVGVCQALKITDTVFSTHRTHGNYLAKGGDLKAMMAELYCRSTGCVGSRGGSMHLLDKSVGMMGSSAIVGGIIPIATGFALASKMRGESTVHVPFFGDGCAEEGALWEAFNFAALKQLPVLFVLENNFYSVCSPLAHRQPENTSLAQKAQSFGIPSQAIDGTCALSVYQAAKEAVAHIREGQGPMLLESFAYRWRGHGGSGDDTHTGYRAKEEGEQWHAVCPLSRLEEQLKARQAWDEVALAQKEEAIQKEIQSAFDFAISSPHPTEETLGLHLYSE